MTSCNFLYYLCKNFAFLARWANLLHSNLCHFKIQGSYLESCAFKYTKFLSSLNHSPEFYKLWLSPRNTLVPGVRGLLSEIGRGSFSFAFQRKSLLCEAASLQYFLLITSSLCTVKLSHACCGFLQESEKLTQRY